MRFHHRRAGEVFAGNQLDVFLLPLALVLDDFSDVRIDSPQAQVGGNNPNFHFVDAALVPAPFEAGIQKGVHNPPGFLRSGGFASQAKDVGVVVLPGQGRGLLIGDQSGAHSGHFVGGHAHANAGGANQHPKLRFAQSHTLRDRLGIIRVIIGFFGTRAEIRDADSALFEVLLEDFLEFKAAVVRAQRNRGQFGARQAAAPFPLLDKAQQRRKPLLNLVPAVEVHIVGPADRIADVFLEYIEGLIEIAQQESFLGRLRI